MSEDQVDVIVTNHGSLWTFDVRSEAAAEWVDGNIDYPDYMAYGEHGFRCEHRYGPEIVEAMRAEGFEVVGSN